MINKDFLIPTGNSMEGFYLQQKQEYFVQNLMRK